MPAQEKGPCRHCGSPCDAEHAPEGFCCHGCAYVHQSIQEAGLERFYDLREGVIAPARPRLEETDETWLVTLQQEAEKNHQDTAARATVSLGGISCIGCIWLIDKLFERQAGALNIAIDPQAGRLHLRWQSGKFDLRTFAALLRQYGYTLAPPHRTPPRESRLLARRIGICAALALNAMLFSLPSYLGMSDDDALAPLFGLIALLCATLSVATGGAYFIIRAVQSLRSGVLHMDTPIAIGILAAYAGSLVGWYLKAHALLYFDFVSMFTFLMLAGRWAQELAIEKNRSRLAALNPAETPLPHYPDALADKPLPARIQAAEIRTGTWLGLPPGATVPVAATLAHQDATFSLEAITGEPEPLFYPRGRSIPAGAINLTTQELRLHAEEDWKDSLLARLMAATDNVNTRNPLLERTLKIYISIILAIAGIGGGFWLAHGTAAEALNVLISILVVSCPCAIGVALPLLNETALTALRRAGIHLRNHTLWGRLPQIRHILFDKTGTLTLETPALRNPEHLSALPPKALEALVLLTAQSLHPASRSLRDALQTRHLSPLRPTMPQPVTEYPGLGVVGVVGDEVWSLGRPGWLPDKPLPVAQEASSWDCELRCQGTRIATFNFEEHLRSGAKEEIAALARSGFGIHILSGDRPEKVRSLSATLGPDIQTAIGGMTPEAKAAWIRDNTDANALMIGDGANDSLAFEAATVRGTPIADRALLEHSSDFYFAGRSLRGIYFLFLTHKRRRKALLRVFGFAIAYNIAAVTLCLHGHMNPLLAAVLMPASAICTLALASFSLSAGKIRGPQAARLSRAGT